VKGKEHNFEPGVSEAGKIRQEGGTSGGFEETVVGKFLNVFAWEIGVVYIIRDRWGG